jgi:hypothetical protein
LNVLRQASYAAQFGDPLAASSALWMLEEENEHWPAAEQVTALLEPVVNRPLLDPRGWLAAAIATVGVEDEGTGEVLQSLAGQVADPGRLWTTLEVALSRGGGTAESIGVTMAGVAERRDDVLASFTEPADRLGVVWYMPSTSTPKVIDRIVDLLEPVSTTSRPLAGHGHEQLVAFQAPHALLDLLAATLSDGFGPVFFHDSWDPSSFSLVSGNGDAQLAVDLSRLAPEGSCLGAADDLVKAAAARPAALARRLASCWWRPGRELVEACDALAGQPDLVGPVVELLELLGQRGYRLVHVEQLLDDAAVLAGARDGARDVVNALAPDWTGTAGELIDLASRAVSQPT